MPPRDKREEDIELLKLVGAVLDNSTSGKRSWTMRLRIRIANLMPRRVTKRIRRSRLFKFVTKYRLAFASAALCLIPLYGLLVVTSSAAEEEPPTRNGPLATAPGPELPTWNQKTAGTPGADADTDSLGHWFGLLKDPDWETRSEAAYELRNRSRESMVVTSSLVLILEDRHAGPRFWAADGLRRRELHLERVKEAVRGFAGNDELLSMYRTGSPRMRDAFERIIKKWLRDEDDLYRWAALTLCGMLERRRDTFRLHLERIAEVDPQLNFRRQADILLRDF